jgi:hypothetical protein
MGKVRADQTTRKQHILPLAATGFSYKGFDKARLDAFVQETGTSQRSLGWHKLNQGGNFSFDLPNDPFQEIEAMEELLALKGTASTRSEALIKLAIANITRFSKNVAVALDFHACATRDGKV